MHGHFRLAVHILAVHIQRVEHCDVFTIKTTG